MHEARLREQARQAEEQERQETQRFILEQKEAEYKAQLERERRLRDIEREISKEIESFRDTPSRPGTSMTGPYIERSPSETPLTIEELMDDQFRRSTSSLSTSRHTLTQSVIDEDEILLSAARVAAHKLAGGRRWLSDCTRTVGRAASGESSPLRLSGHGPQPPHDGLRTASDGSRITVNGYDVALAMGKEGLGRSMSRTEQRIRSTGAHGLATLPIQTPRLSDDSAPRKRKRVRLERVFGLQVGNRESAATATAAARSVCPVDRSTGNREHK
ncbi:hypothetical protein KEM52_000359 [Ascosphaera acerosa]|nr:hypothetical protein KEM52_000359 [Ascosphaera acerosa]